MNNKTSPQILPKQIPLRWGLWLIPAWILLAGILIALFINYPLSHSGYWQMQLATFIELNASLNQLSPLLWQNLTLLGDGWVLVLLSSFLLIYKPNSWLAIIATIPLAGLFSVVGKYLAAMPRPATVLAHDNFIILGDSITGYTSLPSGHSITIFAVITSILISLIPAPKKYQDWLWLFLGFSIATILCLSRVAVGAHWPLDTLIGATLGYLAGISGAMLVQYKQLGWLITYRKRLAAILLIWVILLTHHALEFSFFEVAIIWLANLVGILVALALFFNRHIPNNA